MYFSSPQSTFRALFDAQPQDRFWFGFSYGNPHGLRYLTLSDLKRDPSGERLKKQLKEMYASGADPGTVVTGIVHVDPTGVFVFNGQDAAVSFLTHLEGYVRKEINQHPSLKRLIGARYCQLTQSGHLVNELKNNQTWNSLLPPETPLLLFSQLQICSSVLRKAQAKDKLLFWIAPEGVDSQPLLVLRSWKTEADVQAFRETVLRVQGELGLSKDAQTGFVEVAETGKMIFFLPAAMDVLTPVAGFVRKNIAAIPELGRFLDASLVQLNEAGKPVNITEKPELWEGITRSQLTADNGVLRYLQKSLRKIVPGGKYLFEFAEQGPTGSPILIMLPAEEGGKAEFSALRKKITHGIKPLSRPVKGSARAKKDGQLGIHFRCNGKSPEFLPALVEFVKNNVDRSPSLLNLKNSVYSAVDKEGNVVDKIKDTQIWKNL